MSGSLAITGTFLLGHHTLWTSGRDAWAAYLAGTAAALPLAALLAWLGVRFPGRTLTEVAQGVLGRFLGGAAGLAYALYLLAAAAVALRMVNIALALSKPRTPLLVLDLFLTAAVIYAAAAGLQVLARIAVLALSALMFLTVSLTVIGFQVSDYSLLLPLFEHGLRPAATGALHTLGLLGEMSVLATLQGRVKGGAAFRTNALALAVFLLLTFGRVVGPIALLGPEMLGEGPGGVIMPVLAEMKILSIPDVLERMDTIGITAVILAFLLKAPLFLYAAAVEAAQALAVRRYRLLLLPAGAALALAPVLLLAYPLPKTEEFLESIFPIIGLAMGFGPPVLLLAAAALRAALWRRRA